MACKGGCRTSGTVSRPGTFYTGLESFCMKDNADMTTQELADELGITKRAVLKN